MIKEQLSKINEVIPPNVVLIAVSKTKPNEDLLEAYDAGQRHFGENKVQELCEKWNSLPKDIHWHIIGHLQTNKVKYIAEFIHLIHAKKNERIIPCLLQFHIAKEESKFGLSISEAEDLLQTSVYATLTNIRIAGVMGMASFVDDEKQITNEFNELAQIYTTLKNNYFKEVASFREISMGMSGDYPIAIKCGSTMIRVGSTIFGGR